MVVQLAATFGVTAGIINLASSTGTFKTGFVGHVGLGADNGLHALGSALLIEVENSVHVAVVGHSECWLTIGDCFGDEFVKLGGSIEHGKLGMNMEMGERVAQHQPPYISVEPEFFRFQISSFQI